MAMLLASEPPAMEAYRVSRAVNTPGTTNRACSTRSPEGDGYAAARGSSSSWAVNL